MATIGGFVAAQKFGFHSILDISQANVPYEAASMITTRTLMKENPDIPVRVFKSGLENPRSCGRIQRFASL